MSKRNLVREDADREGHPLAERHQRSQSVRIGGAAVVLTTALAGCGGGGSVTQDLTASLLESPAGSKRAEKVCNGFLGQIMEGATITRATLVAATESAAEHCAVFGEMPVDLDFEICMPTDWN